MLNVPEAFIVFLPIAPLRTFLCKSSICQHRQEEQVECMKKKVFPPAVFPLDTSILRSVQYALMYCKFPYILSEMPSPLHLQLQLFLNIDCVLFLYISLWPIGGMGNSG